MPHVLRAAETESAVGAYRDALALVDAIRPHAAGPCRTKALSLRADLLTAIGDPMAGPAYREALGGAGPADARRLRARLANSAVMAGDLATAAAALDGLDTDGGADDADILLARGKYAFFTADFDAARVAAEQAQRLILAGERNWQVLDLVTLRGLLAHRSDQWFAQMGTELYRTREDWPCRPPSRARAPAICRARAATWPPPNGRPWSGGTPRGRPRWPRHRRRWPPLTAIPGRRGPGCSGPPGSSSGPGQPLDAERCRRTLGAIARDLAGR